MRRATDKKPQKLMLTIKDVAKLLHHRSRIDDEQYEMILKRGDAQAARLNSHLPKNLAKKEIYLPELASPAQVITSFSLEIPATQKKLTEDAITELIAQASGMEYIKIDPLKLELDVVTDQIPRAFALKNLVVPIDEKEGVVTIAVADPFNVRPIEDLQHALGIQIKRIFASRSDVLKILEEFFGFQASVKAAQVDMGLSSELSNLEQLFKMRGRDEIESSDQHIISAVEFLLKYAFDQRASDIHIEPKRDKSSIRFRVDGVLHNIHTVPVNLHPAIVSRLKLLSRLDVAEKRRPQDGRIKTEHMAKDIELRVSTLPVAFGEKVVIRIFDPEILMQKLDRIGFYQREYKLYSEFIRKPNGIVLVTGPTGSGKTTTLYSSLKTIASPEINIITVEDPIEMVMEDFNQVGVQSAIDVTFGTVLRNILRQDPDVLMIGEIRDADTANNAVQAALTGHLVLSTLHTNDAPSSITRLLDIGIPAFLITSTINGIIAQRLLRSICQECKYETTLTDEEITYLDLEKKDYKVWEGKGCDECRGTGYKGRTGIFEVLEFTERLKAKITDRTDMTEIYAIAKADGMVSLRELAMQKMFEGHTTFKEIVSVTG
ncbi:MAG: type II/IV secretion system protein [Deltaproteobacteria bacterium]|nr:MAG: type II/IV secretion system protein [Deltaproteobacteria bacterium]